MPVILRPSYLPLFHQAVDQSKASLNPVKLKLHSRILGFDIGDYRLSLRNSLFCDSGFVFERLYRMEENCDTVKAKPLTKDGVAFAQVVQILFQVNL
jgi:hypothetical protein